MASELACSGRLLVFLTFQIYAKKLLPFDTLLALLFGLLQARHTDMLLMTLMWMTFALTLVMLSDRLLMMSSDRVQAMPFDLMATHVGHSLGTPLGKLLSPLFDQLLMTTFGVLNQRNPDTLLAMAFDIVLEMFTGLP